MLVGELGALDGFGDVVAPEGIDLGVEVGVVGTGDGDDGDDLVSDGVTCCSSSTGCLSSELSETSPS